MSKVILYIATSLDGYIADKNSKIEWLVGDNPDDKSMGSYGEFIKTIDTVILGWNTYNQIVTELAVDNWPYGDFTSYVLTHNKEEKSTDKIIFTDEDLETLIEKIKLKSKKNIWICGGASIVNQLIKKNLIDTYSITIAPVILGGGISLFEENIPQQKLKLISTSVNNGMVDIVYEKK